MKTAIVIGAGFSGISAATSLADLGFNVKILEKHSIAGGRARKFESKGFTFDMGPSWYWMPDVFDAYFNRFGKTTNDYYSLKRLDPSYSIYFSKDEKVDLPASVEGLKDLFENFEPGAAKKLDKFLDEAKEKYDKGIKELVYKPSLSILEFASANVLVNLFKLNLFQSFENYTKKYFKNPKLLQMLEFPILFLGGTGKTTPALYSLMNYGDMVLGTWYPEGGMYKVIEGMVKLASEQGVEFIYDQEVTHFSYQEGRITHVHTTDNTYQADFIISSADYNHTEQKILREDKRTYSTNYWNSRVMSPSSLIFYLGLNKKLTGINHHTLFFDEDFKRHANQIYENPSWPDTPSIYLSCTSKTDMTVAPEGYENLIVLIPVSPGLEDKMEIRDQYLKIVIDRIKKLTGEDIKDHIIFNRSYALNDFEKDYYAFKGNAYGLANTLFQTAFLKPKLKSKKVENLYYTGQLTVPGPGVPPALISGQVVAELVHKKTMHYERTF